MNFGDAGSGHIMAAALLAGAAFGRSCGVELVPGGYWCRAAREAAAPHDPVEFNGIGDAPTFRSNSLLVAAVRLWAQARRSGRVGQGWIRPDRSRRHCQPALRPLRLRHLADALLRNAPAAPAALTVGGAMRWSDWSVGGGLGRAQVLGEDVDLMAATWATAGSPRSWPMASQVGRGPAPRRADAQHGPRGLVLADPGERSGGRFGQRGGGRRA